MTHPHRWREPFKSSPQPDGARPVSKTRIAGLSVVVLGLALLLGPGCDRSAPVPPPPPLKSQPGTSASASAGAGAGGTTYTNQRVSTGPRSIHVVSWPRTDAAYRLVSTHAGQSVLGLAPLSEQVQSLDPALGQPIAAVNGDFYQRERTYAGDPRGLQIIDGDLVSAPNGGPAFWVDAAGQPHTGVVRPDFTVTWPDGARTQIGLNEQRPSQRAILYSPAIGSSTRTDRGRELVLEWPSATSGGKLAIGQTFEARVKTVLNSGNTALEPSTLVLSIGPALAGVIPQVQPGASLRIALLASPDLQGASTAIGGGPILVHQGQPANPEDNDSDEYRMSTMFERHPRAAFGWGRNRAFFVQVDGRQYGLSIGMTLPELARYMVQLGCEEAINLDGGGSATLWYNGRVRNRPCDGFERDIANALVLVRREPAPTNAPATGNATTAPRADAAAISYQNDVIREIPWSVHIARIDRSNPDITFHATLGGGATLGANPVSDQVKTIPAEIGIPLAAVNGDYFEKGNVYPMRPRDLQIRFGEVISRPTGHACFWIESDGTPRMTNVTSRFRVAWPGGSINELGVNEERKDDAAVLYSHVIGESTQTRGGLDLVLESASPDAPPLAPLRIVRSYEARIRAVVATGNAPTSPGTVVLSVGPKLATKLPPFVPGTSTLRFYTETLPALSNVDFAIGGGPTLVRDGKAMEWTGSLQTRHPRTAVGWSKSHYYLAVVDGRQSSVSVGMSFPEFAKYLVKAGCEQAMNLDGGGSTTLWAQGEVRNSPSEGDERPAVNALVAVRKPAKP